MADDETPESTRPSPLPPGLATLYPDVGLAGSLVAALQAELGRAGFDLSVKVPQEPGWRYSGATIRNDHRHTRVLLGSEERWFILEFWERGVGMGQGKTADLAASAGSIGLWQSDTTLRELQNAWPFVHYGELAEAYEHGDPVETKCSIYRQSRASRIDHDLIEAAYAQPQLRQLFPYTSHRSLHLSRATRPPFTRDLPVIWPLPDGRYSVVRPGSPPRGKGEIGLADTPQEAVALLQAHLPDNCGPATDGTVEDHDKTDPE